MLLQKSETVHDSPISKGKVTSRKIKYIRHTATKRNSNKDTFRPNHRKTLTQQVKKLRNIFISNNEIEGTAPGSIYSGGSFIDQELRIFFT